MKDAKLMQREIMLAKPKKFVRELLRMPDGHEIDWYYVDTPRSVMVVPLTVSGNVILVRQYRYNLKSYALELPAGEIVTGEQAERAALREVREETGYGVLAEDPLANLTPLGEFYSLPSETNKHTCYFIARPVTRIESIKGDSQIEKYFDLSVMDLPLDEAIGLIGKEIFGVETISCLFLAKRLLGS